MLFAFYDAVDWRCRFKSVEWITGRTWDINDELEIILYDGDNDTPYVSNSDVRRACGIVFGGEERGIAKIKITMPKVCDPLLLDRQKDELNIIFDLLASNKTIRVISIINRFFVFCKNEYDSWEAKIITTDNNIELLNIEYELEGKTVNHLGDRSRLPSRTITTSTRCNKKPRGELKTYSSSSDDENDTLSELYQKKNQIRTKEPNYGEMLAAFTRLEVRCNRSVQSLCHKMNRIDRLVEELVDLEEANDALGTRLEELSKQLEEAEASKLNLQRTVDRVTNEKEALASKLTKANKTLDEHTKQTKKMMKQMKDYFQKMTSIDVDD